MKNSNKKIKRVNNVTLLTMFSLLSVSAIPAANAGPFDKDSITGTLAIGSGQLFAEDYLIIGLGAGYFVTDGFQLGLDVSVWTGGTPSIYEVTPKLTYVFENPSSVKPYLGMFYNRTFVENFDDSNALGYRAGFYSPLGKNSYIGIGAVYTELQDCEEVFFIECSNTYTELTFIFTL